ncbi:hypothetical protein PC9H_010378 [Pleurotus ostreatus]|uniref:Uncharacterized protein n=2 Tax=Pleurotus TaxID=5320 RepID=A0A8H6ZJL8_PLEOS|nr:uncharacterized protein PC9H_010378 [Pleurotus ostreatus]KAF7422222.1 hypothetical protein PC9H_010378 [Pleurotus ostreatus]KAG9227875.1 hypothetical protein CCMSSC00406_0009132 [Pleurotus cornucopiae]
MRPFKKVKRVAAGVPRPSTNKQIAPAKTAIAKNAAIHQQQAMQAQLCVIDPPVIVVQAASPILTQSFCAPQAASAKRQERGLHVCPQFFQSSKSSTGGGWSAMLKALSVQRGG